MSDKTVVASYETAAEIIPLEAVAESAKVEDMRIQINGDRKKDKKITNE